MPQTLYSIVVARQKTGRQ